MCFGGKPSISQQAAPEIAPPPSPSPGEESASKTANAKDKQMRAIKFGIASTMKSHDLGAASLMTPMAGGLKQKMGQ